MLHRSYSRLWACGGGFLFLLTVALPQSAPEIAQKRVLALYATTPGAAGARFVTLDARNRLLAVVGGHLFTNEIVATRSAEVALRMLRGEKAEDIPVVAVDPNLTQVDWRQLRKVADRRVARARRR